MENIPIDKCTEQFTFRIPEILRLEYEKLSRVQKSELIEGLLLSMARSIHIANFKPELYLSSNYLE